MLKFIWGNARVPMNMYLTYIDRDFNAVFEAKWLSDPYVQKIIKVIDKSDVIGNCELRNRDGRGFSPYNLSSGCKNVILMYTEPEDYRVYYGGQLGDNCYEIICEMAKTKDITIVLGHTLDYPYDYPDKFFVCDIEFIGFSEKTCHDTADMLVAMCEATEFPEMGQEAINEYLKRFSYRRLDGQERRGYYERG